MHLFHTDHESHESSRTEKILGFVKIFFLPIHDVLRFSKKQLRIEFGEELYKLHASVLILILLFQFVFTKYKLI